MCVPIKYNGDFIVVVREGRYAFRGVEDFEGGWDTDWDERFAELQMALEGKFPFNTGKMDDHVCKQSHVVD